MNSKRVKLTIIVEPVRGDSSYTKEYGDRHKGEYPVYSASNTTPLTRVGHFDYDGEYLTWSTNGFGGFLKIISGKFSVNGDRGVLVPKIGAKVNIWYLRYTLQPILRDLAKGRRGDKGKNEFTKVPLEMIKRVEIDIPVDSNNEFDLEAQNILVKKYKVVESLQNYVHNQILELAEIAIDIPISSERLTLKVEEIFDLKKRTNSSQFTKQFVDQNKGDVPVYSASKNDQVVTYGFVKDGLPNIKYFENTLTWNIDGSVGKAFLRKGRFSLSEKVIPLTLQEKWEGLIDYEYIKYSLEEKAVENGFSFSNKAGKARIKDIEISLPKTTEAGKILPDIKAQKRIAGKYREVISLRNGFINQLQKFRELRITF